MIQEAWLKEEFPIIKNKVYLNTAATGVLPQSTVKAMTKHLHEHAMNGDDKFSYFLEQMKEAKLKVSKLINSNEHEIAFLKNTGDAINTVAYGLNWSKDDEIIINDLEFPSNYTPWSAIEQVFKVKRRIIRSNDGYIEPEQIAETINKKTKLIALSFVQYSSGARMPVEEIISIAKERDVLVLLDAIQGIGVLPFDINKIKADFVACGGHKYLISPFGVGFLYVKENVMEKLVPPFRGWLNYDPLDNYDLESKTFAKDARRYEMGNPAFSNIIGMAQSLDLLLKVGISNITRKVETMISLLLELFEENGYSRRFKYMHESHKRSGIINFIPKSDPNYIVQKMSDMNISIAARFNGIRVSPHLYNFTSDIDRFIEKLIKIDKK